jgi:hypothetical protein
MLAQCFQGNSFYAYHTLAITFQLSLRTVEALDLAKMVVADKLKSFDHLT